MASGRQRAQRAKRRAQHERAAKARRLALIEKVKEELVLREKLPNRKLRGEG